MFLRGFLWVIMLGFYILVEWSYVYCLYFTLLRPGLCLPHASPIHPLTGGGKWERMQGCGVCMSACLYRAVDKIKSECFGQWV